MENPSPRKSRGRSRSNASESESNTNNADSDTASLEKTAPNLNGEKSESTEETIEDENDKSNSEEVTCKIINSTEKESPNTESVETSTTIENINTDLPKSPSEVNDSVDDSKGSKEEPDSVIEATKNSTEKPEETTDATVLPEKTNSMEDIKIVQKTENPKEKVPKGRKRKISESLKTIDQNKEEVQKTTDKDESDMDHSIFGPLLLVKEEPVDMDIYPTGTSEILGKGKRARIPNKRYSDIILSPPHKKSMSQIENGNLESGNDTDTSIKEEPGLSPSHSSRNSSPSMKRVKEMVDLSDPKYLKPFKYGWKRELVWRCIYDENKGRVGDIYYFTPQGKKVRSRREVAEHLDNKLLTIDNFSFFKKAIGINDPEKEIVRDAKFGKQAEPLAKQVFTKSLKNTPTQSPRSPKLPNAKITSPKLSNTKISSPKLPSTKIVSPHLSNTKISTPKLSNTKLTSPKLPNKKLTSPKLSKITSPKLSNKKLLSPKIVSPKVPNRKVSNAKLATPTKGKSPKMVSPKVSLTRLSSSKISSPKIALNETADSPPVQTRHAKNSKNTMKTPIKKEVKKVEKTVEKMEVDKSPPKTLQARKGRKLRGVPRKPAASPPPAAPVVAAAAAAAAPTPPASKNPAKKRTIKLSSITNSEEKDENKFMENYLQNLSYGYNTLLYVFQYLKVQDLLRAGCVCTMWRDIASHPMLWKTVRMKNSQVHSFEGLANSLKKYGTRHLDLRKMLLPTGGDEIWPEFSKAIEKVDTLRRIELCRCPASVVEKLAVSNPYLEVINAVTIKCENMNLEPFQALKEIKELRLKSTGGLTLTSNIDSLKDMKGLKHLSLTSIRDLDAMNLNVIAELSNLESLDLGECTDFPKNFGGEILIKLTKLEKLRLEKGQGNCHTFEILEAVKQMSQLDQLELVNFDIKSGFDKALGVCQNIKKLLIIPTYISQSATTNHMVLGGVLRLQKTLSHFVWGVTLELLRVTELFVDQCEEPKEKKEKKQVGNGDCIPVLKPVPLLLDKDNEIAPALEPPQVEILALSSLQKLLMQNLPTTRVKILKIPFHATWRQSITDSVN